MRLCFVADYRSPIARQWIDQLTDEHEVHVVSSYPVSVDSTPVTSLQVVPLALSGLGSASQRPGEPTAGTMSWRRGVRRLAVALPRLRRIVGPLDLLRVRSRLAAAIERSHPDAVHALRIPFEAMATVSAVADNTPFIVSIWGNDLTLHAESPLMAAGAERALRRADALQCDCYRDIRLAQERGWRAHLPSLVVPGNGGVDRTVFHPGDSDLRSSLGLDANTRIVVNPRGVREYVEWKAFLHAARAVSATRPDVHFVCAGMAEHAQVSRYVRRLGIGDRVTLLPSVGHEEMADVFRAADVSVSPATHDGTPNTLLEAMACGAVPVVGAVSSVLEWIEDGRNGVVCDPTDPSAMTAAINRALDDTELRARAIEFNLDVVAERADLVRCRELIDRFYQRVLDRAVSGTARGGR